MDFHPESRSLELDLVAEVDVRSMSHNAIPRSNAEIRNS